MEGAEPKEKIRGGKGDIAGDRKREKRRKNTRGRAEGRKIRTMTEKYARATTGTMKTKTK